jgi:hypothetical protein
MYSQQITLYKNIQIQKIIPTFYSARYLLFNPCRMFPFWNTTVVYMSLESSYTYMFFNSLRDGIKIAPNVKTLRFSTGRDFLKYIEKA